MNILLELINNGYCENCKRKIKISGFTDAYAVMQYEDTGLCEKCQTEKENEV